jgi:hypothetical protein
MIGPARTVGDIERWVGLHRYCGHSADTGLFRSMNWWAKILILLVGALGLEPRTR